ncbi:MAG: C10 family peptidase [Bacteroidales bacterium]|nr:C10 family peptidase [Bacteroidales bacterium]
MDALFPGGIRDIKSIDSLVYDDKADLFIVNLGEGGWILMPGDKKIEPVLAFSYEDRFAGVEETDNTAFDNWIRSYAGQVQMVRDVKGLHVHEGWEKDYPGGKGTKSETVNVDPLISALWGQGSGWNRFCPVDSLGPDNRTYVGCVAVAMAQALSVYMVPDTGAGSNKYYREDYGTIEAEFYKTAYKWDSMSLDIPDDYNALLLFQCAVAVNMNFGPDGSSARTANTRSAMKDYFKMSGKSLYWTRKYHEDNWVQKLTDNLLTGHPIIYSGNADDGKSGHAFNVDGIKYGHYFHINWGWGGNRNGYFLIDKLKPGSNDFSQNHAAVFDIQPYYYPTGVSLSDTIVPISLPAGSAFIMVEVIDEAYDNEYDITLITDSLMVDDKWIMEYYLEDDSIRTGRVFTGEDIGTDTVRFQVYDRYDNFIDVEVVLTVADTTASATAIYDNVFDRTRIYPNPASGIINIDMGSNAIPVYLRIYSSTGLLVKEISTPPQRFTVETGNLPGGLYIFEAGYRDGSVTRKKVLVF